MTNILYVSFSGLPSPDIGGGNRIIYELLKHLSIHSFSPSFVSYSGGLIHRSGTEVSRRSALRKQRQHFGRRLFTRLPLYRSMVSSPWYQRWYYHRAEEYFRYIARRQSFQIIHAHHPIVLPYFTEVPGKKIVTIHHKGGFIHESRLSGFASTIPRGLIQRLEDQERTSIHTADIVTFPSQAAKELYFRVNDYPCNERNIRIVYNGIDIERIDGVGADRSLLRQRNIRQDAARYILNIADHVPQKNLAFLLHTIGRVVHEHHQDILLINIGSGPGTSELNALIRQLRLERNVVLLGRTPNTEAISLMKVCDGLVMTSVNVIFDLVVLEAMACGLPVYASDDGGNREVIRDGVNGFLLHRESTQIAADQLMKPVSSGIRSEARTTAVQRDVRSMTAVYESIYRDGQNG